MTELLAFKSVQKTYDGKELIVKNLNLAVAQGEFVTLLGPSGSGKTTSLMMLAGFESPTSGEIYLDGAPIQHVPPYKRNIGVVFQNYALFPHMTVGENIGFPLSIRKVPGSQRLKKVKQALEMVKLENLLNRYPGQLSGGQRQRVALARALVFEPKLVLMDEPLGALDKQLREHMQLEIKHLHEALGLTIVYVTHDQGEALTMSDRVAVFNDGAIQQISDPQTVYDHPQTRFVAEFIGENNALSGSFVSRDGAIGRFRLADDTSISARCDEQLAAGQAADIYIRPELIDITQAEGIPGLVKDRIYMGDHVRLVVELNQSQRVVVKAAGHATVNSALPGSTVKVSWNPDFAQALMK